MPVADRKTFFDDIAPRWNTMSHSKESSIEYGLEVLGNLAGLRVADIGCGTGALIPSTLAKLGTGKLVAIDFAAKMLQIARTEHPDTRIHWLCCDAADTPLEDGCLDVILCYNALPHFPRYETALSEFYRCLDAGGRLLIWHDQGRERIAEVHRKIGPPLNRDVLPPIDRIKAACEKAGYVVGIAREDDHSYMLYAEKPARSSIC